MDYLTFKHFKIWKDLNHASTSFQAFDHYIYTNHHNFYLGEIYWDQRRADIPNVCHFIIEDDSDACSTISELGLQLVAIEIHPIEGKSITLILDDYVDSIEPEVKAILVQP
jgi:hypothetical protein